MGNRFSWESLIQGYRTIVSFSENGPRFRLTVVAACDDKWEWTTAVEDSALFFRQGEELGDEAARQAAEDAIPHVAEQARQWHQANADKFREVGTAVWWPREKPPATPMPGGGRLITNG